MIFPPFNPIRAGTVGVGTLNVSLDILELGSPKRLYFEKTCTQKEKQTFSIPSWDYKIFKTVVQLPRAKCSNILGYSVPKIVITKLGCVHETQLKPAGLGLGPTESVGKNAWYAGTLVLWYAGREELAQDMLHLVQ